MKVASEMRLNISTPISSNAAERKIDADTKELSRKLNRNTGFNFDQAFVKGMRDGHEAVIALITSANNDLSPSQFKEFVSDKFLPSLHHHFEIASNLNNKMVAEANKKALYPAT